jgi:hypothetical protein
MNMKKQNDLSDTKRSIQLNDNENYFYTHDMGCSASLVSVGFELISLNRQNPQKVLFIFKRKIGIDEAVNNYFEDKLSVNARTLIDNIKNLKNRIYSSL